MALGSIRFDSATADSLTKIIVPRFTRAYKNPTDPRSYDFDSLAHEVVSVLHRYVSATRAPSKGIPSLHAKSIGRTTDGKDTGAEYDRIENEINYDVQVIMPAAREQVQMTINEGIVRQGQENSLLAMQTIVSFTGMIAHEYLHYTQFLTQKSGEENLVYYAAHRPYRFRKPEIASKSFETALLIATYSDPKVFFLKDGMEMYNSLVDRNIGYLVDHHFDQDTDFDPKFLRSRMKEHFEDIFGDDFYIQPMTAEDFRLMEKYYSVPTSNWQLREFMIDALNYYKKILTRYCRDLQPMNRDLWPITSGFFNNI